MNSPIDACSMNKMKENESADMYEWVNGKQVNRSIFPSH